MTKDDLGKCLPLVASVCGERRRLVHTFLRLTQASSVRLGSASVYRVVVNFFFPHEIANNNTASCEIINTEML
jgi:hypothetical protein